MGVCELLTIIFVVCHLLGIGRCADWTMVQCLIPEIIAVAFYVVIFVLALIKVSIFERDKVSKDDSST